MSNFPHQYFLCKLLLSTCFICIFSIGKAQEDIQHGFSWTHEDIFISNAEGSDLTNIHIYGWGSLWPFPDGQEGEYDDGSIIDSRIARAIDDGQEVMLTLATAPSNFRASGEPWNLEEKVNPEHEDLFVERIQAFIENRMDIMYVQVWNEFKGYWHVEENRWDYEAYTTFYNKVYTGVKEVREDILVGGGYMALRERGFNQDEVYNEVLIDRRDVVAMEYWLEHAVGFDAICLDGDFHPEDYGKVTEYFRTHPGANGKPIWWSEFYNKSGTMLACAENISESMQDGDKMLWWAEERFLPFTNPSRMTTSTSELSKYDLKIYPNPARDFINVEGDYPQDLYYEIYTTSGLKVKEGHLHQQSDRIDISMLKPNLYLLKMNQTIQKILITN